ncbi:MAG: glycosyltransferase family 4 protein [Xylanivirga thermophila]|jgi:glycosyltransferase involved in cell wall biosynthesis|uniref:glycosyltransferase family 4 protein n=1 Tax=Xylanivirga thermophila TaxID=2496273 RepID=UPI0039F4C0F9
MTVMELLPPAKGGMVKHFLSLSRGLKSKDARVIALCTPEDRLMEELSNSGIECIPFFVPEDMGVSSVKRSTQKLTNIIKKYNPDILHVHGFKASIIGRRAAQRIGGISVLYTVHNFLPFSGGWKLKMARFLEHRLYKDTCAIITVSDSLSRYMIQEMGLPSTKMHVVYNGIDTVQTIDSDLRDEMGISNSTLVVGTTSRLIPAKGIDYLLDAIPMVLDKYDDIKFIIIGDGPEEDRLKARAHGISDTHIIFTGYVENIEDYYGIMDIFVLPTLSEGLGISVLEAMSFGIPVIASYVGGIPEIINHRQTGYLIPPANKMEIGLAILNMIDHPDMRERLGKSGKENVEKNFKLETMIDQTWRIMSECYNR